MNSEKFSDRISDLSFDKDLNELANKLNVSVVTIYSWRSGENEISLSNLIAVANYFQVSLDYLSGRSDDDRKVLPIPYPEFGKRVRTVMKERKITTYYLRKNYKYGSRHFENWDKGANPLLSTLIELSDIFACTVDYLVCGR